MVKHEQRLTSSTDFKRVRLQGKPFSHPLLVLIALPNDSSGLHIGITAGKSVGNAVARNRAKRRLRACLSAYTSQIHKGWDLVVIARAPISFASYLEIQRAVINLLKRSGLASLPKVIDDSRSRIS